MTKSYKKGSSKFLIQALLATIQLRQVLKYCYIMSFQFGPVTSRDLQKNHCVSRAIYAIRILIILSAHAYRRGFESHSVNFSFITYICTFYKNITNVECNILFTPVLLKQLTRTKPRVIILKSIFNVIIGLVWVGGRPP